MSKLAKTLSWILPFAALAAGVAGYFLLPDTLVMQIGLNGQPSNLLPKLWGLLIPLALTLLGAIWSRAGGGARALAVSIVGLLMDAFLFICNL